MDAYAAPKTEYRYRDLARLTSWLRLVTWVNVVLSGVFLLATLILGSLSLLVVDARIEHLIPVALWSLLGLVYIISWVIVALLFFFWIYRAAANVHALGADITFTPGWAVGWFFIPIIQLWMSFVVVEEIWRASKDARDWRSQIAPWIVIDWWGIPVAAWVMSLVLRFLVGTGWAADIATLLSSAARLWVAFLFIAISRRICAMQQAQMAASELA